MSPLLQFLIRAYLPLAARHMLIDAAAQTWRKPSMADAAGGAAQPASIASVSRRLLRRDERKRADSLAA
ncbi:MAG: hypothetical protein ABW187_05125 [Dokdonella sp.]